MEEAGIKRHLPPGAVAAEDTGAGLGNSRQRVPDLSAWLSQQEDFDFQALSPGLGLGDLRDPVRQPARAGATASPQRVVAAAAAARSQAAGVQVRTGVGRTAVAGSVTSSRPQPAVRAGQTPVPVSPDESAAPGSHFSEFVVRRRRGLAFYAMALAMDFVFVISALAVVFALVSVNAAVRTGETEDWMNLKPLIWLTSFGPLQVLAAVYGFFLIYVLLLQLAAGGTIGIRMLSWLGARRQRRVKA